MFSQVNNGQKNYETYAPSNNSGSYGWDYSSIATKKIRVQLQAGENTIKFSNDRGDGQYAPDLDYIVITPINVINYILRPSAEVIKNDGRIYNLNGQEVTSIRKGAVYIRNGKKFMVR